MYTLASDYSRQRKLGVRPQSSIRAPGYRTAVPQAPDTDAASRDCSLRRQSQTIGFPPCGVSLKSQKNSLQGLDMLIPWISPSQKRFSFDYRAPAGHDPLPPELLYLATASSLFQQARQLRRRKILVLMGISDKIRGSQRHAFSHDCVSSPIFYCRMYRTPRFWRSAMFIPAYRRNVQRRGGILDFALNKHPLRSRLWRRIAPAGFQCSLWSSGDGIRPRSKSRARQRFSSCAHRGDIITERQIPA